MESSDEEFVWTNTSKDDSDSEVEMPDDGESESGKSYKKKLQKELFQNGELDSSPEAEGPTEAKGPAKRNKRHKRDKSPRASPPPAPPAPRVKREPRAGHDDSAAGEHILNMKVKEERASFVAPRDSPRERRASVAEPERAPKKKKKKRERKEEHDSSATEAPAGAAASRNKKKQKRDSERNSVGDQDLIIDKFEADETVVEQRVEVNGHPQKDKLDRRGPGSGTQGFTSKEFIEDDDSSDDARPAPAPASPARARPSPRHAGTESPAGEGARNISKRIMFEEPQVEPEASKPARRISERITFEESQYEPGAAKQPRRISERITFEESQSESEPERPRPPASPERARSPAARLGRYLRAHAHLRPVLGAPPPGAALTADDDVWLLRAPRELDARALAGATLAVDARSKLKLGGRALEAAPAGGPARVALLLPAPRGRGFCVRAVAARGALRLRARPPRARAPPAAGDEEPERVPLPETRPRHPLLGAAYERAATLAPDVRRRLAAASARARGAGDEPDAADDDASERREKKKKKKKHRERPEEDPVAEIQPEIEEPKPKKRKRKHSSRAEPDPPGGDTRGGESPPRRKKAKRERPRRDEAAVWDSEQAIEDSLFNF